METVRHILYFFERTKYFIMCFNFPPQECIYPLQLTSQSTRVLIREAIKRLTLEELRGPTAKRGMGGG